MDMAVTASEGRAGAHRVCKPDRPEDAIVNTDTPTSDIKNVIFFLFSTDFFLNKTT